MDTTHNSSLNHEEWESIVHVSCGTTTLSITSEPCPIESDDDQPGRQIPESKQVHDDQLQDLETPNNKGENEDNILQQTPIKDVSVGTEVPWKDQDELQREYDMLRAEFQQLRSYLMDVLSDPVLRDIAKLKRESAQLRSELREMSQKILEIQRVRDGLMVTEGQAIQAANECTTSSSGASTSMNVNSHLMTGHHLNMMGIMNHMQPVPSRETVTFLSDLSTYYRAMLSDPTKTKTAYDFQGLPHFDPSHPVAPSVPLSTYQQHIPEIANTQLKHRTMPQTNMSFLNPQVPPNMRMSLPVRYQPPEGKFLPAAGQSTGLPLLGTLKADVEKACTPHLTSAFPGLNPQSTYQPGSPLVKRLQPKKRRVKAPGDYCCTCHPRSSGTCQRCHGPEGFCTTKCRNKNCRFKALIQTSADQKNNVLEKTQLVQTELAENHSNSQTYPESHSNRELPA